MKKLRAMVRSVIARLFDRQKVGKSKVRKTVPLLEEFDIFGRDQDGAQRYFFRLPVYESDPGQHSALS